MKRKRETEEKKIYNLSAEKKKRSQRKNAEKKVKKEM